MKTKTIRVRPWKIGDWVVAQITDFNITQGKEYQILGEDVFVDCFKIKNDIGEVEGYSEEYFEMKVN